MASQPISIAGLKKSEVLQVLYAAAKPQGLGHMEYEPGILTDEEAEAAVSKTLDFDYLKGRVLKVDISGDTFEPYCYDRDNGQGTAEFVIDKLKRFQQPKLFREENQVCEARR